MKRNFKGKAPRWFDKKIALAGLGLAAVGLLLIHPVSTWWELRGTKVAGIQTGPPQTIGSIPYWDQSDAIASFKEHTDQFDFITVFWYALRSDGSIGQYPYANIDTDFVAYAQEHGVKVQVLIANLPTEDEGGDWDWKRVDKVISSASARQKHIAEIVALVKQYKFDGVNIDYEALRQRQRKDFTAFIRELAEALHREGKHLGVSLHAKVGENNLRYSNGSQAQDWKELARYADQLRIMTIEQHWESSGPGPAASVAWMEPILKYAQKLIPADKLFVVMPLYGYDWTAGERRATGLTYEHVQALIAQYNPTVKWDGKSTSHYFAYTADGEKHTVWFEDARSTRERLKLLQRLGLSNLSFWRLGNEDERVWEAVTRRK